MLRAVDTAEGIWEVGLYRNYLKFCFKGHWNGIHNVFTPISVKAEDAYFINALRPGLAITLSTVDQQKYLETWSEKYLNKLLF